MGCCFPDQYHQKEGEPPRTCFPPSDREATGVPFPPKPKRPEFESASSQETEEGIGEVADHLHLTCTAIDWNPRVKVSLTVLEVGVGSGGAGQGCGDGHKPHSLPPHAPALFRFWLFKRLLVQCSELILASDDSSFLDQIFRVMKGVMGGSSMRNPVLVQKY